jgi:hypothetical protein
MDRHVVEEARSTGEGAGVELEQVDQVPARIDEPFDPENIDVQTRTPTVQLLLSRIEGQAVDLAPDFQRRGGIWSDRGQSRLIESLLLKIPLPTFYAAEDADEKWEIVDGIQRLTAIVRFVNPALRDETPLHLRDLEYLEPLNGKSFAGLPARLQRRLLETEFIFHIIRHKTPGPVKFNIFARINTGGTPLSAQELRHALIPGDARRILREWADLEAFKTATDHSVRDERMADAEMVLRFIAFNLFPPEDYDGSDFDSFLRKTMEALNARPADDIARLRARFLFAMDAAWRIFGADAFRKRYDENHNRYPVNKALFEAVSVTLGRLTPEDIDHLATRAGRVRRGLIEAFRDPAFDRSVSQGTGDLQKIRTRFSTLRTLMEECLDD